MREADSLFLWGLLFCCEGLWLGPVRVWSGGRGLWSLVLVQVRSGMSRSAFYRTFLGLALLGIGLGGCLAGTAAKGPTTGTGGSGAVTGGAGATGQGGMSSTGTGGTGVPLPIPPGCGDGINNQGGIEQCDDGNTIAGDGCNGDRKSVV